MGLLVAVGSECMDGDEDVRSVVVHSGQSEHDVERPKVEVIHTFVQLKPCALITSPWFRVEVSSTQLTTVRIPSGRICGSSLGGLLS